MAARDCGIAGWRCGGESGCRCRRGGVVRGWKTDSSTASVCLIPSQTHRRGLHPSLGDTCSGSQVHGGISVLYARPCNDVSQASHIPHENTNHHPSAFPYGSKNLAPSVYVCGILSHQRSRQPGFTQLFSQCLYAYCNASCADVLPMHTTNASHRSRILSKRSVVSRGFGLSV